MQKKNREKTKSTECKEDSKIQEEMADTEAKTEYITNLKKKLKLNNYI